MESAKKVVQALDDADAAQNKARNAIKLSNEDISLARADLEQVIYQSQIALNRINNSYRHHSLQIDGETGDAQNKADETARKVNKLSEKLSELQKKFLKNILDATEIKNQSDQVRDSASNAHDSATQVPHLTKRFHFISIKCLPNIRIYFLAASRQISSGQRFTDRPS